MIHVQVARWLKVARTSLLVARVKFEPESSSSHESSSSQVIHFFNFILISFDCDSFFFCHNVAPTDAQNIISPRDIFPVKRSREFIPSVGNNLLNEVNPIPCLSSSSINFLKGFDQFCWWPKLKQLTVHLGFGSLVICNLP